MDLLDRRDFDALEQIGAELAADERLLPTGFTRQDLFFAAFKNQPDDAPDSAWVARIECAKAWAAAKPRSASAPVALGELWVGYAWRARGDGYASSVSSDDSRLFRERLANAHRALDDARRRPERIRRWWITAARVDLGEGWDTSTSQAVFEEGCAAFPACQAFYCMRAVYLQPKWHGAPGEWLALAQAAADRFGGDEGDALYARVVWYVQRASARGEDFGRSNIDWVRVLRGFEVLMKQYPGDLSVLSEFCLLSCIVGDAVRARVLFGQIQNRVDSTVWSKETFIELHDWAFAN